MPFKQLFERKVNENMQEDDGAPGRAPPADDDIKKMPPPEQFELEDFEQHEKKDLPPRFSTLFNPQPAEPVLPQHNYQQEYYPRAERRRGVYVPTPLFVVFAIILFFESTILFAYTIIGLYNNAPSRLLPWAGPGVAAAVCEPAAAPANVNFAPNFILGGEAQPVISVSAQPERVPTFTTTTSTSTISSSTTSSTSISTTSTEAAAAASNIAGILGGLATASESAVDGGTVTSIKLITSVAPETVTQTTWVPAPTATA